ncbi:pyridoxal phosphate-dependent aminotransferase [Allofranklinella schreckenbergeri]|uniref:alanine transaminase n=1 Tax=Allofranklinella schreckenbergeri TaxID=1076744 RepID=A0A3M6QE74_9BURK|nr:pyridoxal phosphate-dependent aminotransferase [Allofranklinella schreckenbergeri]RMX00491.1 pyridoxal phosphate-dependent aminotransferase [Allofranklinella schreckenbergeri]RMX00782.1 pyridoxal phosphate-dependent aminotransferase [Allofranklinella schreckenbergeri]RMX10387.1 pyridoxal phosphate-dependent aminotransferase [Allofranklinella schreckenbergeri]RRD42545.1 aminotransferase class I/II-fold pyridoxal phosphate-dependent enzyme [Comamonadaceae bacterium OH3737_COT-264]
MKTIHKSAKLANVLYDIRGPIVDEARRMEDEGQKIIKLNIGNLAAFGFDAPEEVQQDMIRNLPNSAGYSDSKGIFAARKAVMHETQRQGIAGVTLNDIYLGNGASELIAMATNALLDDGDELLLPAPDYPLWTAVTNLSGGTPVHYICDESNNWEPDLDDIRSKITPRTKGIVVINPNNPTGVIYSLPTLLGIVEIAREHGLVLLADEVYDKVLYDGNTHTALASLAPDVLTLTFNSLSKSYRSCGYRAGWMIVSGDKNCARDYIEGLDMLANMKLCSNVPGQWAIQTALGGYQSIHELTGEGGRLRRQRDLAYEMINAIPGVSCVKPQATLYMFPKLDLDVYPVADDRLFFLELLRETRVMLVQGTGFNWPKPDHFRIVFLPHEPDLREAIERIARFLRTVRERRAGAISPVSHIGKKAAA